MISNYTPQALLQNLSGNMTRIILLQIILLFTILGTVEFTYAQNYELKSEFTFTEEITDKNEIIPVVVGDSMTVLFFLNNYNIQYIKLSDDLSKIDESTISRPHESYAYNNLLGYAYYDDKLHLLYTNNSKRKLLIQTVDINTNSIVTQKLDTVLQNERLLDVVTFENKMHVITSIEGTSIIGHYQYDQTLELVKQYDFSEYKFSSDRLSSLYQNLLDDENRYSTIPTTSKIDISNPTSLDLASNSSKMYLLGSKFIITFDNDLSNTKMVTIDLKSHTSSCETIENEAVNFYNTAGITSNSFLSYGAIYQVKACKGGLVIRIKDLQTKKQLATYSFSKGEKISFLNGAMTWKVNREDRNENWEQAINSTGKFLLKMSNLGSAITAYESGNKIILTIGGYKEKKVEPSSGGGGMMQPGASIPTGYGGYITTPSYYSPNPVMSNYESYKNSKAVYFISILNTNLAHMENTTFTTAYEKIRTFEESQKEPLKKQTIFKMKNALILGFYDTTSQVYYLYKFADDNS